MKKSPLLFPNASAVTNALNLSPNALKQLKARGAAGFRANGNVDVGELLAWLVSAGSEIDANALDSARARLADARVADLERRAKTQAGELAPTDKQRRALYLLSWHLIASLPSLTYELGQSVAIHQTDAKKITDGLRVGLRVWLSNSAAAAAAACDLPAWAVEAFQQGFQTGQHATPEIFAAEIRSIQRMINNESVAAFYSKL